MPTDRFTSDQVSALNSWVRTVPTLNSEFPYVNTNGEGLGDLLNAMMEAALPTPLAIQLDEVGTITYVGEAAAGSANSAAAWRIKRIDESGDPEIIVTYADGDTNFDNVWDSRLTLSYS